MTFKKNRLCQFISCVLKAMVKLGKQSSGFKDVATLGEHASLIKSSLFYK